MLLGALNGLRACLFGHRAHGGGSRRRDGPAQLLLDTAGIDHYRDSHGRAGRFAVFTCLAYLSFHVYHRRRLDDHRTGADEHDPQRRAERDLANAIALNPAAST